MSVFYIPHAKDSWHMCQTSGFENGEFVKIHFILLAMLRLALSVLGFYFKV